MSMHLEMSCIGKRKGNGEVITITFILTEINNKNKNKNKPGEPRTHRQEVLWKVEVGLKDENTENS